MCQLLLLPCQVGLGVGVHHGQQGSKYCQCLVPRSRLLSSAHLSVSRKVDLECLAVVLKSEGCHGEENVFTVDSLSLLLLAFFRSW